MSAYNEDRWIGKKIENILQCDYPKDRIEILVGSDGSTDNTNSIISDMANEIVKPYVFQERRGKPSVINDLTARAKGDVLVFCDIRQRFEKDAIVNLVANFTDEKVGCVSGELIFDNANANGVAEGVGMYWGYEKIIRKAESDIHSMLGATGAIYAIRRELYSGLPENTILDDVYTPLSIARKGYRCIFDTEAKAYDNPISMPQEEYRRKVRTLAGNYQIFSKFKMMLIPFLNPVAIPLISHKLLRVLAPFFMISLLISNIVIARVNFYASVLLCQIIFYILAILGSITYRNDKKRPLVRIASTAYMFCLMNFTAIAGLYRFIFGKQEVAWEK